MFGQYISELLYKYDTVILPGFGVFVLHLTSSSIQQAEQKFTPPAKHVSFNPSITGNDGILANYISEKEKISFFDACNKILAFVEKIKTEIAEGKQVNFEKIGVFHNTADNNISFTPDATINYNTETYGLEEIVFTPVIRDDTNERLQKQSPEKPCPVKEKRKFPKVAIWILSVAIISVGVVAVLLISKNKKEIPSDKQTLGPGEKYIIDDDTLLDSASYYNKYKKSDSIAKAERITYYYIIFAGFRIEENAKKYAETLKQEGYHSSVIFLSERRLHLVSCDSFASQAEAEQALSKFRTKHREAWIFIQ